MNVVHEYLRLRGLALRHLGTGEGLRAQRQMDALYPKLTKEQRREVGKGCREQDGAP